MAINQRIESRAPTRIDLAGGTVDLWPLYLFLENPVTLNLGIDLFAEASLETRPPAESQPEVTLRTEDQNFELRFPWRDLEKAQAPSTLELHLKFLRHFARERTRAGKAAPDYDLSLATRAKSPAGAGLGGSSTLSIAMIGALATWARGAPVEPLRDGERLIEIARDVETTVIQVPAGVQDYYGAMFGGLQSLRWKPSVHERAWLPESILAGLEARLLLFYSGQSRNSGINNWALYKSFIDNQGDTRASFRRIVEATRELEAALVAGDWQGAGSAITREWNTRRGLAPGISTPEMDRAFHEAARIAEVSGKVCGAGGGGCFFVYLADPDEERKERIRQAFVNQGIRPLPFRAVPRGLEVWTSA